MALAPVGVNRSRLGIAAALLMAGASVLAAARDPRALSRFLLGFAYSGVLTDAGSWQTWADANASFFGPLQHGARVGLVEDIEDSTGLLITRTDHGMRVRKTHFLRWSRPPVVIAMEPPIAAELRALDMARDGNRFWDGVKSMARRRALRCYRFSSREEMEGLGLAAFLRNIDVYDPADFPAPH